MLKKIVIALIKKDAPTADDKAKVFYDINIMKVKIDGAIKGR